MGAAKTRELFSLRKLDLTSLAQGFAAQLAAHILFALALFSVGVGARGVDWVSSTSSHLAAAARAHVDGLLVSWETMLPEWWRGWLFGLLTAALLMDVVAVAETRLFGDAPGSASAIARAAGRGAGTAADPRRARDDAWAALLRARWLEDPRLKSHLAAAKLPPPKEPRRLAYASPGGATLHGEVVVSPDLEARKGALPGVVLFHTAAGPRDLFLSWKAEVLAARGCCVLVADLFGDANGDGWDGAWAAGPRAELRDPAVLLDRAVAAVTALRALGPVDGSKCACLGWCLGGRAAAALAAASPEGLKAAVSFHGVFDAAVVEAAAAGRRDAPSCALLILSGSDDPFVPDLDGAVAALAAAGVPYETHVYGGAKHGFTNPAQALNENDAFAYDDKAATGAWALAEGALVAALG